MLAGPRRRARSTSNDEQIDNQLRSVLFQVPKPGVPTRASASTARAQPRLLQRRRRPRRDRHRARPRPRHAALQRPARGVRARAEAVVHGDHRRGDRPLPERPADRPGDPINDPDILDFVELRDTRRQRRSRSAARGAGGRGHRASAARRSRRACRRSTATSTSVDAFVGMVAEPHVPGTEFGELQLRDLEAPVRGAPRRRPLLLPERSGARPRSSGATASATGTRWPRSSSRTRRGRRGRRLDHDPGRHDAADCLLTEPAAGEVSGTVTVSADAADDTGVEGVEFDALWSAPGGRHRGSVLGRVGHDDGRGRRARARRCRARRRRQHRGRGARDGHGRQRRRRAGRRLRVRGGVRQHSSTPPPRATTAPPPTRPDLARASSARRSRSTAPRAV